MRVNKIVTIIVSVVYSEILIFFFLFSKKDRCQSRLIVLIRHLVRNEKLWRYGLTKIVSCGHRAFI